MRNVSKVGITVDVSHRAFWPNSWHQAKVTGHSLVMEWALCFTIVKKKITHALYVTPTWSLPLSVLFFTSRAGPFLALSVIFALQAIDIAAVNHKKFFSIILPMILNAFAAVSKLFRVQPNFFELHSWSLASFGNVIKKFLTSWWPSSA